MYLDKYLFVTVTFPELNVSLLLIGQKTKKYLQYLIFFFNLNYLLEKF